MTIASPVIPVTAGTWRHKLRRGFWIPAFAGMTGLLLSPANPVFADSLMPAAPYANQQLPDPAQEARAQALMESLRCLVCQGQSIADSDAEMAGDMRSLVRTRIAAGEQPEAIRKWLVERYGSWVSFKPPLDSMTWPLWGLPILFIGFGAWLARGRFKRRAKR